MSRDERLADQQNGDEQRIERESEFWDDHAHDDIEEYTPDQLVTSARSRFDPVMPWLPYLGVDTLVSETIAHLGSVEGKRVLDLGCGTGFMSSLLAANGATVIGVDVSTRSLEVAAERAEVSGLSDRVSFQRMACESLDFPDGHFDAVVGSFVLHHTDLSLAAPEIGRVLKPGAPAAFIETWGRSNWLMAARRMIPGRMGAPKYSSDDEAPLSRAACAALEKSFPGQVDYRFPIFLFFRMGHYLPILKNPPCMFVLKALDKAIESIRAMRQYSYFAVVTMRRGT